MKKSLYKLEKISNTLSSHQTYYSFNKDENISSKYKKGRVTASKWLNELILFFIEKESRFLDEFKNEIQKQKNSLDKLKDSEYKKGLYDELNITEDMLNDRIR